MKLSLQLILETLTEYGAQLIETDGDFTFTGVQILTSPTDILEPDTLYVCTPKVLPKLKKQLFENHCFVFKAKPSQLQCHHALHGILLDENTDLNEVVNRLITLFTQFHAFEFAIKEASLERRGYEPFFEIAKKAFPHCLIVVTDSAYNIVCSTRSSGKIAPCLMPNSTCPGFTAPLSLLQRSSSALHRSSQRKVRSQELFTYS